MPLCDHLQATTLRRSIPGRIASTPFLPPPPTYLGRSGAPNPQAANTFAFQQHVTSQLCLHFPLHTCNLPYSPQTSSTHKRDSFLIHLTPSQVILPAALNSVYGQFRRYIKVSNCLSYDKPSKTDLSMFCSSASSHEDLNSVHTPFAPNFSPTEAHFDLIHSSNVCLLAFPAQRALR